MAAPRGDASQEDVAAARADAGGKRGSERHSETPIDVSFETASDAPLPKALARHLAPPKASLAKKKRPNGPSRQRGDRSLNLSQAGRGCAKWISLMLERPRPAAAHALRHCGGYAPMRRCPRRPGSCCRRARAGGADLLPCSGRRRLSRHALWGSSARARASRCGRPGWQK